MPPAEVLRCDRCLKDKKKCELQDGTNQCKRCIEHKCACENRVWRVPKRRSNADTEGTSASNQGSRTLQPDVNAANVQYTQALQFRAELFSNDYPGHVSPGDIGISAYPLRTYRENYGFSGTAPDVSFIDNPQSQATTSFAQNTHQTWHGLAYGNNASADTDFGFYMPYRYDQMPDAYSQQGTPYRRGRG